MRYTLLDYIRDMVADAVLAGFGDALEQIEGTQAEHNSAAAEGLRTRLARLESRAGNGQLPAPGDDEASVRRGPGRPRKNP